MNDLSEVYDMLAENVETWTDQWKQQDLEQGREAIRHILVRQVRRRFGPEVAEQSRPLLARISDLEQLEELADQLLLSPDGDAWLAQLKERLEKRCRPMEARRLKTIDDLLMSDDERVELNRESVYLVAPKRHCRCNLFGWSGQ